MFLAVFLFACVCLSLRCQPFPDERGGGEFHTFFFPSLYGNLGVNGAGAGRVL